MIWIWIALGGAIGAVGRHALSVVVAARTVEWTAFPAGTFTVNVIGCFAAGVLVGLASRAPFSTDMRTFLAVGILGGFTTFSAFTAETFLLIQSGHVALALANVLANVVVAFTALWVGVALIA
jgi:CrcB protein